MIIYGTGMYGKKNVLEGWTSCDNCGTFGKSKSYDGRLWGHLYFIPLIPSGPKLRVMKECSACKHGLHLPLTRVEETTRNVIEQIATALSAVMEGDEVFSPEENEEVVHCGLFIANSIELLCCLDAEEEVYSIIDRTREIGATFELSLIEGAFAEFQGDGKAARNLYVEVLEDNYDNPGFQVFLGEFYLRWDRTGKALEVFEKAHEKWPDSIGLLSYLLSIYESLKEFDAVCDCYEKMFELAPDLAIDKKVKKAYTKACKKARRDPQIIS